MIRKYRPEDKDSVLSIVNFYVQHSFAAYPEEDFNYDTLKALFELPEIYPFHVIEIAGKVIGFGLLRPHLKMSTFRHTAEITYFILPEYTARGLGRELLDLLLLDAKKNGFEVILASIPSLNPVSLNFHRKYGFEECGRFKRTGGKFNKNFDGVWMQKFL
jgi:phosphinothricin acetyltransferase